VAITASVNTGDAVEPNIKQRIEADISPTADLYLEDAKAAGRYGSYIVVLPSSPAKSARKLYAVSTATYRAGQWQFDTKIENGVDGFGKPADLFPRPILVEGGDDEARYFDRIKLSATRQAEAQLASLQEDLKARLQMATAKAQQERDAELARLQVMNDEDIAKAKAELAQSQALIDIERQKRAAIAQLAQAQTETATRAAEATDRQHQADMSQAARKLAEDAELRQIQGKANQELAARRTQRIQEAKTALAGSDISAALTAFESALSDSDEVVRTAAMNGAFFSTVPEISLAALRQVIKDSKTLAVSVPWPSDLDNTSGPKRTSLIGLTLKSTTSRGDSLYFEGEWSSALFRSWKNEDSFHIRGTLSGDQLVIQNQNSQNGCMINVQTIKNDRRRLAGNIDCAAIVLNNPLIIVDLHTTALVDVR
jgi:hypothetical protein